jgi:hypothetical protein
MLLAADFINTLTWWQWGLLGLIPPAIVAQAEAMPAAGVRR